MENERYISVPDMLGYALRRWKNALNMGLVFAVLLGLLGAIKGFIGGNQAMELSAVAVTVISAFGKFAIIGYAAGVFANIVVNALGYAFSDKVYSADTLKIRNEIDVLGVLALKKVGKKDKVISWIEKLEKRAERNDVETVQYLARAIHVRCCGMRRLLITGYAGIERLNQVAAILNGTVKDVELLVSERLADNPEALNALAGSEAVLLVEMCGESLYSAVEKECGIVKNLHKNLLGCVLFE